MEAFAPTNVTIQSIHCRMHRSVLARVVLAVAGDQRVSQRLRRVLIAMHRSESGASLATTASGDVGTEVYIIPRDGVYDDLVAPHGVTIGAAPSTCSDRVPSAAAAVAAGGSIATEPSDQCGIGTLGVYQANWGGHRNNRALNDHINNDVIIGNPCQIIAAQEVDAAFVQALQRGGSSDASVRGRGCGQQSSSSASSAVAGAPAMCTDFRDKTRTWAENSWLVAAGSEDGKTNIVAGKASIFKSVSVLEWVKTITGTYKSKNKGKQLNAFSRCLVAELVFAHPWCGRSRLRVACVHVHYKAAKTDPKTAVTDTKCHAHSFWLGLKFCFLRTKPDLICGDFNMALYAVPYILTHGVARMPKWPLLLSSYVWVKESAGTIIEEDDDDSDGASSRLRTSASSNPRLRNNIGSSQPPPPPMPPPRARTLDRPLPPPPSGIPPKPSRPPPGAPGVVDFRLRTGEAVPLLSGHTAVAARAPEETAVAAGGVSSAVAEGMAQEAEEHFDQKTLMFDSCGIFALWSTAHVRRHIPLTTVNGTAPTGRLERFASGQGYGMQSYKRMPEGWWEANKPLDQPVPEPFETEGPMCAPSLREEPVFDPRLRLPVVQHPVDFKWEELPAIREKMVDRSLFDESHRLLTSGAHMPLMVFLGSHSRRSPAALERRAASRKHRSRSRQGSPVVTGTSAVSKGSAAADGPAAAADSSWSSSGASAAVATGSTAATCGPTLYTELFV